MSFKPEVIADSSGQWAGNALRFATYEEAKGWVVDRAQRWIAVREIRVVESDDPITHRWVKGRLADYEPPDPPGWEGGFADNH